MNFKILNSAKKGSSIPKTNFIGIELPSTQRMLRRTDMAELVNQQDVFNEERGKCHKYRFVFTVNQLFTNVLFNQITRFPEHHRQSINDGEYDAYMFDSSLFGKYMLENGDVYMGANILDNHLFRSDTISHANSLDSTRGEKEHEYVYSVDTTMSFFGIMQTGIYEKNGWLGVKNPSKIRLNRDDDKPLFVDKSACDIIDFFPTKDFFSFYGIYDEKAHESKDNWKYVLTYPFDNDMQHYLVNKGIPVLSMQVLDNGSLEIRTAYKNNLQYGDVFILTDETQGDKVEYECSVFSVDESQNAIEVKYYPSEYDGENRRVFINSNNNYDIADIGKIYNVISRNGDFNVHITKKENGLLNRYYIRKFRKIPNFKFEQFEVNGDNIEEMIYRNRDVGFSSENYKLSFAKNAYNDDMSQITYNEDVDVESLMDNLGRPISKVYLTIIKDNDEIIRKYSGGEGDVDVDVEYPFTKVQSGFKLTNFNRKDIMLKKDGMMQDVFTRGDSNNLPFTALYDKYCNIQYVHSVGTEETGFVNFNNLSERNELFRMNDFYTPKIYRDNKLVKGKLGTDQEQETQIFTKHVIPLEDNISEMGHRNPASSSSDIEPWFYGDIVEYSPSQCMETILEDIYYRFNTSQRESCKECDDVISFNEIIYDEFDLQGVDGISNHNFKKIIDENGRYQYNSAATSRTDRLGENSMIYRGLLCVGPRPEGYMYKPHYEIQLKKWSKNIHQGVFQQYRIVKTGIDVTLLNPFKKDLATGEYTVPNPNSPEVRYRYFVFDRRHGLHSGDFIRIFSKDGSFSFKYNVKVDSLDKFKISIFDDESLTKMIESGVEYEITKYAYDVPPYAEYVGDGRYLWRDLLGDGERDYEDGSVLEHVFANGRFYLNQNITLAMQRQDPMGDAGLLYLNFPQDIIGETDTRRKRDKSNTNYSC